MICLFVRFLLGWSYKSCVVDIYVNHDDVMTWKRQLAPIKNRTHDNSYPWHFALKTTTRTHGISHSKVVHKKTCTQSSLTHDNSYPRQFVPRTTHIQNILQPNDAIYMRLFHWFISRTNNWIWICGPRWGQYPSGPRLNIKTVFSRYSYFHYNRPS